MTRTIPQEMLWLKTMETVASELTIFDDRHSDLVPTVMFLHQGALPDLKSISQIALMSPLLRPSLIVLSQTGGLADLVCAILKNMMTTANTYETGYNGYLHLFGSGHSQMLKRLGKHCENTKSFYNYVIEVLKIELDEDYETLREKILIIFTKCFILPSDIEDNFDILIQKAKVRQRCFQ